VLLYPFRYLRWLIGSLLARFGRPPEPDEPLLFRSDRDQPVAADRDESRRLIVAAAMSANIEVLPVLKYLGLSQRAASAEASESITTTVRGRAVRSI